MTTVSMSGKHLSAEHRAKMSAAHKGKHHTSETRAKISAGRKGKTFGPYGSRNGGILRPPNGYIEEYRPDHPHARNKRYMAQHRLVMEASLGRYLEPWETVHHKNGIKDDNRSENLELWIRGHPPGQRAADAICPHCGRRYVEAF